ncbi:hypothetical protein BVRB_038220, partial [Beta vulgaris subsp. vulgaris]
KAKKGLNQAEQKINILEAERGEVEEANNLAKQIVTKIDHQYHGFVNEWNQKHTALYGVAARFSIDQDDDNEEGADGGKDDEDLTSIGMITQS